MSMRGSLLVAAVFLALAIFAIAPGADATGLLANGAITGGPEQAIARCAVHNTSLGIVGFIQKLLFTQDGQIENFKDTCGKGLGPLQSCYFSAWVSGAGDTTTCLVVITKPASKIRGVLSILDNVEIPLASIDLR